MSETSPFELNYYGLISNETTRGLRLLTPIDPSGRHELRPFGVSLCDFVDAVWNPTNYGIIVEGLSLGTLAATIYVPEGGILGIKEKVLDRQRSAYSLNRIGSMSITMQMPNAPVLFEALKGYFEIVQFDPNVHQ
jgi:hypothetical protein